MYLKGKRTLLLQSLHIKIFFFTNQVHGLIRAMKLAGKVFLYLYFKNNLLLIISEKKINMKTYK